MSKAKSHNCIPVICVKADEDAFHQLSEFQQNWLMQNEFSGQNGHLLALPDSEGRIEAYVFGLGNRADYSPLALAQAAAKLPAGNYCIQGEPEQSSLARLAFLLGTYHFTHYKTGAQKQSGKTGNRKTGNGESESSKSGINLQVSKHSQPAFEEMQMLADAAFIARDLINTPANELGPQAFDREVINFASQRNMDCRSVVGEDLLEENFPMIHAVGRASSEAPRLLELNWGDPDAPKVTLVGKGVTFDTGGLNIKSAAGMILMKKDMGGAANVLGLAHAIVTAGLNVRLRVLLPVVENAISGSSFRPGDILPSRAGLSVEIGNTDAEGRLILADALAYASEDEPDLLIDMATLTGAARVALGPDLPPVYSPNETLARQLVSLGNQWGDPLWHMPLWGPYNTNMSSPIADINHIGTGGMAGSVLAALFLQNFVGNVGDWVHMDIYGWMPKAQPGRTQGGTDQGIRAAYMMLKERYS